VNFESFVNNDFRNLIFVHLQWVLATEFTVVAFRARKINYEANSFLCFFAPLRETYRLRNNPEPNSPSNNPITKPSVTFFKKIPMT
jgi:hypothetical protein